MKQIAAWIALVLAVVVAAGSRARGQDVSSDHTYTTEHEEHVTVERTTTTVHETTVVHVNKPNYKCAIFVENHADNVDSKKAVALQDLLTGYAAGKGFNIIAEQDVMSAVNDTPNSKPSDNLDSALANDNSALRLARTLGADYVLVCTITSYGADRSSYRDPSQDINLVSLKYQMRTTFRLLDAVDGGSEVAGVAAATIVDRVDPRSGETERQNVIDDLLDADALDMADMLSQDAHTGLIGADTSKGDKAADVNFEIHATAAGLSFPVVSRRDDGRYEVTSSQYHPDVIDATVSVDGVVVGTTGSSLDVTPGLHKIRIHQPLFQDWAAMVNVHSGMKLDVALQLSDEGVQQYADLSKLFEHLQANAILTDAQAKVLEGKATELSHSSIRVGIGDNGRADMDVRDPGTGAEINTGTTRCPACLQQHHPAHVAGRLAFLDHLSKGRLNLCFGPGSVTSDQELFGCEPKDGGAMSIEATDMILKMWASNPPYEIDGKYWKINLKKTVDEETGIGYIHKPLQKPHPPIAIPGMSRDSFSMKYAGKMGFSPFCHCLIPGNVVADVWKTYATAAHQADRPASRSKFRVARTIFLADTTREAKERARTNSVGKNYQYIGRLFDKGLGRRLYKRDLNMSDADCNLDYLMNEQIIAGDVDEVLRRLLQMVEETGPFGTLVMMSYDWDDKEAWVRSLELFQNELMPALNKALCGQSTKTAVV